MSDPDEITTPFDSLQPVKAQFAANYLREAVKALDHGDTAWARSAIELLAHELEIDAAILQWVATRHEKGPHRVCQ